MTTPPATLVSRYSVRDLEVFDDDELRRFVGPETDWDVIGARVAWELLYRKEPDLYERLIAGETISCRVIESLPHAESAIEIAAGSGRLTKDLAKRCAHVVAVEPAEPLRARLDARRLTNVETRRGFFDAIPAPDDRFDLVVSCSALTSDPMHGGDAGVREMERVAASGALIALVWPADVDWLRGHGFTYERFDDDMSVDFGSVDEAVEIARIFYPHAARAIVERGTSGVPYDVLGMNPPCDWAYKRVP